MTGYVASYQSRKLINKKMLQSVQRLQHFVFPFYIFVFFDTNVTSPLVGLKTFQEAIYKALLQLLCNVVVISYF